MSKSASQPTPKRSTRARSTLNRRSVQNQVDFWENAAQVQHGQQPQVGAGHLAAQDEVQEAEQAIQQADQQTSQEAVMQVDQGADQLAANLAGDGRHEREIAGVYGTR